MKKFSDKLSEAVKTVCQTPGTKFTTEISDDKISVIIELPMSLDISKKEAKLLEDNIHNAMELVLAKYFTKE
jgi:hypothetical protein